jgi:hypothetical protein
LSSVHVGGVHFQIYPRDHAPIHAHGRYGGTAAIVVLLGNGAVELARRADAVLPPGAKRSDVRRILDAAEHGYEEIVAAWEQMRR